MSFKALFIDTNIFLHYHSFDEIDWLNILNVDQVEIQLPMIVIQELDKHKYNRSSSKLREKATKVVKKLYGLVGSSFRVNLKPNIDIYFEVVDKRPDFAFLNLDPNSQDDRLLASILLFKSENPNSSVVLVAADLGLLLKAKGHHIEAICLPIELKLPVELDQTEKRIKELEQEVLELRRRTPDLKLCFLDGSNRFTYKVKKLLPSNFNADEAIEKRIGQLQQEFPQLPEIQPKKQAVNPSHVSLGEMYGSDVPEILPSEIISYNKEIDEFYKAYKQYSEEYIPWLDLRCRVIILKLSISNSGTCPAEDVDIFTHFPDGFTLCKIFNFPKEPQPPEPPSKPILKTRKDRLNLLSLGTPIATRIAPLINSQNGVQPNVSSPDIRRSNSYDVEVHVHKLKQNKSESFDPIAVVFESFEQVSSFQIDYRIIAENIPKPLTGNLHVILNTEAEE